jgi:hypothetical protein
MWIWTEILSKDKASVTIVNNGSSARTINAVDAHCERSAKGHIVRGWWDLDGVKVPISRDGNEMVLVEILAYV